jgi:hypothetical protein
VILTFDASWSNGPNISALGWRPYLAHCFCLGFIPFSFRRTAMDNEYK